MEKLKDKILSKNYVNLIINIENLLIIMKIHVHLITQLTVHLKQIHLQKLMIVNMPKNILMLIALLKFYLMITNRKLIKMDKILDQLHNVLNRILFQKDIQEVLH